MKQQITVAILIACSFTFLANKDLNSSQDCKKYKKGIFYYNPSSNSSTRHYKIIRNDNMQFETNIDTGDSVKLKLYWLNDCTYEMRFVEGSESLPENLLDLKKKMVLKTTILSGTDKYYIFKTTHNLGDFVLTDTIWFAK